MISLSTFAEGKLPIVRFLNNLFPIPNFRIFFAELLCQMVALRNVFFAEWFFAEWQNCGILLRNDLHSFEVDQIETCSTGLDRIL